MVQCIKHVFVQAAIHLLIMINGCGCLGGCIVVVVTRLGHGKEIGYDMIIHFHIAKLSSISFHSRNSCINPDKTRISGGEVYSTERNDGQTTEHFLKLKYLQLTIADTTLTSYQWHLQWVIKHKIKRIKGSIVGSCWLSLVTK